MMSPATPLDLKGKRILVTGACGGIGGGAATIFAQLGAQVFLADINAAGMATACEATGAVGGLATDITKPEECDAAVAAAVKAMNGLDGMFNPAGVGDPVEKALDLDLADWRRVIDINLWGLFLMCRSAGRVMTQQGSGSIVSIASVNGISGIPRRHAYGPSKAGVIQLTRTLACEWAANGVRVNSIAPGYIRPPAGEHRLVLSGKTKLDTLNDRIPLGRRGEVAEVGRAAAFLLSDWASYITGALLPVDGGWTAYGGAGAVRVA
jgi:NAD(P)-dependent dehydrogenase (short-subunit alcohol dehydrogenase family)